MKKILLALSAASVLLATPVAFAGPPAAGSPAAPAAQTTTMRTPANASTAASSGQSLYARAQTKLKADNLYRGAINGRRTEATIRAIRNFQGAHHLTVNGRLDAPTQQALGV